MTYKQRTNDSWKNDVWSSVDSTLGQGLEVNMWGSRAMLNIERLGGYIAGFMNA